MGRIPRVEGMLVGTGVYNSKSMGRRQRQVKERELYYKNMSHELCSTHHPIRRL